MCRLVDRYKYDHVVQIDIGLQYRNGYYLQKVNCIDKLMAIYINRWLNRQIDGQMDRRLNIMID